MTSVKDLLDRKNRQSCRPVCTISPMATVLDAVLLMNRERIGALVVLDKEADDEGRLVGIFTERDVLTRVVGEEREPQRTRVGEVMTSDPVVCSPTMSIEQVKTVVTQHRIRHLPVIDAGRLVGLITSGDVVAYEAAEQETTIRHLHAYITG